MSYNNNCCPQNCVENFVPMTPSPMTPGPMTPSPMTPSPMTTFAPVTIPPLTTSPPVTIPPFTVGPLTTTPGPVTIPPFTLGPLTTTAAPTTTTTAAPTTTTTAAPPNINVHVVNKHPKYHRRRPVFISGPTIIEQPETTAAVTQAPKDSSFSNFLAVVLIIALFIYLNRQE